MDIGSEDASGLVDSLWDHVAVLQVCLVPRACAVEMINSPDLARFPGAYALSGMLNACAMETQHD